MTSARRLPLERQENASRGLASSPDIAFHFIYRVLSRLSESSARRAARFPFIFLAVCVIAHGFDVIEILSSRAVKPLAYKVHIRAVSLAISDGFLHDCAAAPMRALHAELGLSSFLYSFLRVSF